MQTRSKVVGGLVLLAVGCGAYFACRRPEDLEVSGKRLVDCALAEDVDCVLSFCDERESELLVKNGADLRKGVRVLLSGLSSYAVDGAHEASPTTAGSRLAYAQPVITSSGARETFSFEMYQGDGGNRTGPLIQKLLVDFIGRRWDETNGPYPEGRDRLRFWGTELERATGDLRAAGITGVVKYDKVKDEYMFLTLEDQVAEFYARASGQKVRSN